jgi:DNA (cytosine-5)-methyltransferase 1
VNELALFAGAGGGILGGCLLGWRTVCAVEIDPYARAVLLARQRDGCLPRFPIWDDIRTFDGRPWRGRVDIVSGGFPCQDISTAGKGAGITGPMSGLWSEMLRVIRDVRPEYCCVENSPALLRRGMDRVACPLAEMGYTLRWGVVGARHAGLYHHRDRLWILAHSASQRCEGRAEPATVAEEDGRAQRHAGAAYREALRRTAPPGPSLLRAADGVAGRMDRHRLRVIGNGQCPQAMAMAWRLLVGGVMVQVGGSARYTCDDVYRETKTAPH